MNEVSNGCVLSFLFCSGRTHRLLDSSSTPPCPCGPGTQAFRKDFAQMREELQEMKVQLGQAVWCFRTRSSGLVSAMVGVKLPVILAGTRF